MTDGITLEYAHALERNSRRCAKSYKNSDTGRWAAACFASKIVGKYSVGATIQLANEMGVSSDTIENLAHAYQLYEEFRNDPRYKTAIRQIRKQPYIYYSYFRSLYKAKNDYHLSIERVFSILVDVYQGEGKIKLADLDQHIQDEFGDTRTWEFYGEKAMKEIHVLLQQPDLPQSVKQKLIPAYEILGDPESITDVTNE